jgi:two-component system response regulator
LAETLRALRRAMARAGVSHRLVIVPDGRAAIDYLSDATRRPENPESLPSMVLLDVNMPLISGFEVLQWIRATPPLKPLITLMLSSSNHSTDVQRAYALGANGYLIKPCTIEETISLAKALNDYWLTRISLTGSKEPPCLPTLDPSIIFQQNRST